jgi:hypothetical protein
MEERTESYRKLHNDEGLFFSDGNKLEAEEMGEACGMRGRKRKDTAWSTKA